MVMSIGIVIIIYLVELEYGTYQYYVLWPFARRQFSIRTQIRCLLRDLKFVFCLRNPSAEHGSADDEV